MAKSKKSGARSRKKRRGNNNSALIFGVVIVALIAVPILVNAVRQSSLPGERFGSQGNVHISLDADHAPYNSNPPTSGPHTPQLASWGAYYEIQPDERLVHNMEDGGVILWYQHGSPEENEEHVNALEGVASGFPRTVIAPREDMPTTYALTAWTRLQRFDEVDREAMREFINAYHGIDHH